MGLFKRHGSSGGGSGTEAAKKASARSRSIFRLFHQAIGSGGGCCSTPLNLPPTPHPQSTAEDADADADAVDADAPQPQPAPQADDATASKDECSSSSNNQDATAGGRYSLMLQQVALPSSNAELPLLADSHNAGAASKGDDGGGGATRGDEGGAACNTESCDDAFHATALDRFKAWQQIKRPNFRFGPRKIEKGGEVVGQKQDKTGSFSSKASEEAIVQPSKSAFVYQDGKFVEREVCKWPRHDRVVPHARYRNMEPYASQYGLLYQQRMRKQHQLVSPKHRLIYEAAIYRLPKRVMEENKNRLMRHHVFKNHHEGAWSHHVGPQVVDTRQRSQIGQLKMEAERQYQKDAEYLTNYITRKHKALEQ